MKKNYKDKDINLYDNKNIEKYNNSSIKIRSQKSLYFSSLIESIARISIILSKVIILVAMMFSFNKILRFLKESKYGIPDFLSNNINKFFPIILSLIGTVLFVFFLLWFILLILSRKTDTVHSIGIYCIISSILSLLFWEIIIIGMAFVYQYYYNNATFSFKNYNIYIISGFLILLSSILSIFGSCVLCVQSENSKKEISVE